MIWLDPTVVSFGGVEVDGVESIAVDRRSERLIEERSDNGPHVVFADCAEERVSVRLVRRVGDAGGGGWRPGDGGLLGFRAGPSAGRATGVRVSVEVVVTAVLSRLDSSRGAMQTVEFVAISVDGDTDPVTEEPVGMGGE